MGLFLQTAVLKDCDTPKAKQAIERVAQKDPSLELLPEECKFHSHEAGTLVFMNEHCCGYESLAELLSLEIEGVVLLTYIYDEDFWGYFLYDRGTQKDEFLPLGQYFQEDNPPIPGNPALLASCFGIQPQEIDRYLVVWEEDMEEDVLAYPQDEFPYGDCWQMADFLKRLGFPYPD